MLKTSLPLGLNQPNSSHSLRSGQAPYRQQTPPTSKHSRRLGRHRGFTLLEVLIATAVTMLMMLGLAQIFRVLGESMSQGRAGLELNNRLRSVMHRIRTDLDNVTVTPRPPITVGTAQGYLKYYEGPASDFSIARVGANGSLLPAGQFNDVLTRFGDIDDIFMATVKAKDTWFTGKVPRFVAERRDPASAAELFDYVTISSQFAEVVIFAQPTVRQGSNGMRDPAVLALNDLTNLAFDPNTLAVGIPNSYRLHYRTLLIRPDLNLESGRLGALATANVMVAQSQDIQVPSNLDPNLVPAISELGLSDVPLRAILGMREWDMYRVFQHCDLSMRRVDHTANISFVAANTLEDLANPANRFGHLIHQVPGQNAVTMPVLALTSALTFQEINTPLPRAGFLHPAFALMGDRTGEDVLTTDLLAFDVKAYDSGAPVICFVGADGEPGVASVNDDQNSITDRLNGALDLGELGAVNSDDITLKPGDPGFLEFGLANLTSSPIRSAIIAYGEYVDLNWAGKLGRNFPSELSGYDSSGFPTIALFKSGLVKRSSNGFQIFQPSYDTYTNLYESDGVLQAQIFGQPGLVTITGNATLTERWRNEPSDQWDAGTDGVDNNAIPSATVVVAVPGVDDPSEQETSPPFPVDLRGLQISVRLEDPTKKQFKQMSTVKQFVTN